MTDAGPEILSIFGAALECPTDEARATYLDRVCGADAGLRSQLAALIAANAKLGHFLEGSPASNRLDCHSPIEQPGTVIGPYKLLEQIGEGGMGLVFMAEQTQPVRRKVALKVLKPGMDTRQIIARFEAERQTLALMDHPNIAQIFDAGTTGAVGSGQMPVGSGQTAVGSGQMPVGSGQSPVGSDKKSPAMPSTADRQLPLLTGDCQLPLPTADCRLPLPTGGRPYFVMELVRGVPITEFCDQRRLSTRQRLELFVTVCHAVQHAHQKGIIHRDLKPSNILVTLHDTIAVPKIIDFGISKATKQPLTERSLFTNFSQMIGTPLYMSPEQAEMNSLDVDTRSDVYSLGVLLYELLTGTTPFASERLKQIGFDEMRRVIRDEEPPRPSQRVSTLEAATRSTLSEQRGTDIRTYDSTLRGELDWIVIKALEKDRNRRYESASAFAADVQRYLNDEPVQACPPSTWYRFRKFARRNKAALAMSSVIGLAMLAAVAVLAASTILIANAKEDLRRDFYFHRITLAQIDLSGDNLAGALKLLSDCPRDLRDWEWHYLSRLCRVDPLAFQGRGKEVRGVAFSPDGRRLAAATNADGAIGLFDMETGAELPPLLGHKDFVFSVAFQPKGTCLASASADETVKVWDLTTGKELFSKPGYLGAQDSGAYGLAFSPDGRRLAAANAGGILVVWDATDGTEILRLHGHEREAISVAFSPDGKLLASSDFEGTLRFWNAQTGKLLRTEQGDGWPMNAVAFSPDGGCLATTGHNRHVKVWDMATGARPRSWRADDCIIHGLAFSPDGRRLATIGGKDKTVKLWDPLTGREILKLRGHALDGQCVAFSPDGRRLASSGLDGTIRIWDATPLQPDDRQELLTLSHDDEVWSVAFNPNGQGIASAGLDKTVRLWNAATGAELLPPLIHPSELWLLSFSRDGKRLASLSRDRTVRVWDTTTGQKLGEIPPPKFRFGLTFSPDGRYLLVDDVVGPPGKQVQNHVIKIWDAETGQDIGKVGGHGKIIWCLAFSPDGQRLVSSSNDGTTKLWHWDPERPGQVQQPLFELPVRHFGTGNAAAFSPDGLRLATVAEERTVKIWDANTGKLLRPLNGHSGDVYAVAFSPDGRWLASAGVDTTVALWDAKSFERRHRLRGHTGDVMSLAFSPDSERLISGSKDGTVKVWDMTRWDKVPGR